MSKAKIEAAGKRKGKVLRVLGDSALEHTKAAVPLQRGAAFVQEEKRGIVEEILKKSVNVPAVFRGVEVEKAGYKVRTFSNYRKRKRQVAVAAAPGKGKAYVSARQSDILELEWKD